jgi:hypothetical protein
MRKRGEAPSDRRETAVVPFVKGPRSACITQRLFHTLVLNEIVFARCQCILFFFLIWMEFTITYSKARLVRARATQRNRSASCSLFTWKSKVAELTSGDGGTREHPSQTPSRSARTIKGSFSTVFFLSSSVLRKKKKERDSAAFMHPEI